MKMLSWLRPVRGCAAALFLGGLACSLSAADVPPAAEPASPEAWYGAGVRPSDARTPDEERAGFHLPPGFVIELVTAEPNIAKPMNLAWDARGRLWVTDSYEYPYPAKEGTTPRDSVHILEDTDGDGSYDRVNVFATELNIPIGVLPYGDGCLCFSIPNIYYLRDTDGDGKCDAREVVLGPFDTTRDTHGMINSMRMGPDGWVYANHGFNNQSKVSGKDGHTIEMQSGNSFRFRPDGSRVEHVTWGQVNPFGRATDAWGYALTADCHSKPISQLIREGYYPSFGRPHDGLGFVPPMMDHLHGSTAISGVEYIGEGVGWDALAGQTLSGNVMTSRLNRNHVQYQGATAQAIAAGDFLTSDDPWFRPVDVRLGPDGCLYVADFYNKIIGHYEVPLTHPERDRFRGRIWRIRPAELTAQFSPIHSENVLASWDSANGTRRDLGLSYALAHPSESLDEAASQIAMDRGNVWGNITALWYLLQRGKLDAKRFTELAPHRHAEARVRMESLKVLAEMLARTGVESADKSTIRELAVDVANGRLVDRDPHVVRAAAELLGQIPAADSLELLVTAWRNATAEDAITRQTIRIALRNQMRDFSSDTLWNKVADQLGGQSAAEFAELVAAIESPAAGTALLSYLERTGRSDARALEYLAHAARCLKSQSTAVDVIVAARRLGANVGTDPHDLIHAIASILVDSASARDALRGWANELAAEDFKLAATPGGVVDVTWKAENGNGWPTQPRNFPDGRTLEVTSSFPLGETYTGRLVSDLFPAPPEITFFLAGHHGYPDKPAHGRNRMELVDGESGRVLHSVEPPRNDALHRVTWNCNEFAGRLVRLRCVDGDSETAYAWLAFGGFQPEWLEPTSGRSALSRGLRLVEDYKLNEFRELLAGMLVSDQQPVLTRADIGRVIAVLEERPLAALLFAAARDAGTIGGLPEAWVNSVLAGGELNANEEVAGWSRRLNADGQRQFASRLVANRQWIPVLLETIDSGAMSAHVLTDKTIYDKVDAVVTDAQRESLTRLAQGVAATDSQTRELMTKVLAEIEQGNGRVAVGAALFTKHCSVCHQLAGVGQVVGPQLDGVGGRGAARLLEDIVQPDLNVDRAFRASTVLTVDGQVLTGLVRGENGDMIDLVGTDGKPFQVIKDDVEEMRAGVKSLMPGNFTETLNMEELASLVTYLEEAASQSAEKK